MSRILYRLVAALVRLVVRSGRSKDLEIIVLRRQLVVLRRHIEKPSVNDDDRTLLGAIAAALPRPRRHGWIVTPDTVLRWHRPHTEAVVSLAANAAALVQFTVGQFQRLLNSFEITDRVMIGG